MLPKQISSAALMIAAVLWVGCGSNSSNNTNSTAPPGGGGNGGGGGGGSLTPTTISVSGGKTSTGIDISVPPTASSINATLLGANDPKSTTGSASNTGGAVARGASSIILIFGTGLGAGNTVSISGPKDINVGSVIPVKASDGTPGLQFTISVASNAAVGARTVVVQDASNNITAFTGGLEIF